MIVFKFPTLRGKNMFIVGHLEVITVKGNSTLSNNFDSFVSFSASECSCTIR